jgi:hypothetical protein
MISGLVLIFSQQKSSHVRFLLIIYFRLCVTACDAFNQKGIVSPSAQRSLKEMLSNKKSRFRGLFLFEREKGFEPSTLSLGS